MIDVVFFKQSAEGAAIRYGTLSRQRDIAVAAGHYRSKIIVFKPFENLRFSILERQLAEQVGGRRQSRNVRL